MRDYTGIVYRHWAPLILTTLNCLMYVSVYIFGDVVYDVSAFSIAGVAQSPYKMGTIFTSQFVHGSVLHFGGNTMVLLFVGILLRNRFSNVTIFTGYVISGAVTTIAQAMTVTTPEAYIIGGSGGLFFLITLFIFQQSKEVNEWYLSYGVLLFIPTILFEQTYKLITSTNNIGYTSHIAGTILGIIFVGYILYRTHKRIDD